MHREKVNATQPTPEVLRAAMQYLNTAITLPNFRTLDQDVHYILESFLCTDLFEEQELREKVYFLLQHAKALTSAFKEITDQELIDSCNKDGYDNRS
ncbi:hypothetical protein [Myroides odoratimimus]|nr:hypothetical protein [Myroides odoratimimus]